MAILAIFTGDGGLTKDMYDNMRNEIGWEKNPPKGAIFHAASFDDKGVIRVADVWNSAEEMNAFATANLMPIFQKYKVNPPKVDIYPVHNIDATSAVEQYINK